MAVFGSTSIDGFTLEQRFFLSFGQIWCESQREEILRLRVLTDPHSPGRYGVIGVLQDMSEFQKASSCKPGQAMVREKICRVW
jgi:predicted metalloendopeptidase